MYTFDLRYDFFFVSTTLDILHNKLFIIFSYNLKYLKKGWRRVNILRKNNIWEKQHQGLTLNIMLRKTNVCIIRIVRMAILINTTFLYKENDKNKQHHKSLKTQSFCHLRVGKIPFLDCIPDLHARHQINNFQNSFRRLL